jgi:hypothetical protein
MTMQHMPDIRTVAVAVAATGTLFWLYTFHAIAALPPGDGTGFQWLAVIPLGAIFIGFFLPAWLLVAIGRWSAFAAALGICGLIAFAIVWTQLRAEFHYSVARVRNQADAAASSAASRSASARSSVVLALKNGSNGSIGHVAVTVS